ncbi:MIP family channel protein [Allomyces macrogynus ATCC 38327]|uniref:MIP family channel protein n=1 Tax=Allomyces macrogynus (strain ATCC 38327) TaxID=578462 RepID=A0A0L0RV88_ALLM3|nr:MIP family channel protein [Allomyces macrogynus ATCC 38327]|eukprot:KNE54039.1 MIP family channel protein [Allomyces macrogynus ATCC 38327]
MTNGSPNRTMVDLEVGLAADETLTRQPAPTLKIDTAAAAAAPSPATALTRFQTTYREYLAEILGTFMLVLIGEGSAAQSVLSNGAAGDALSVRVGFAAGIFLGVLLAGDISGGHLNPAVTFAMAVHRGFPWRKVPFYIVSQGIGAFLGSLVVYVCYLNGIQNADGGIRTVPDWTLEPGSPATTAGIFATYPAPYMSTGGAFLVEMVGTMVLVLGILGATDPRNGMAKKLSPPVAVALSILAVGVALGGETSFAINPARDFAPRVMLALAGYGSQVWAACSYYFWVPFIAPYVGGTLAGFVMQLFCSWPAAETIESPTTAVDDHAAAAMLKAPLLDSLETSALEETVVIR